MTSQDDRPVTIEQFRERMRTLRAECGNPTQAEMRQAIATFKVDKLPRATLSEFLNDVRAHSLPRWEFVRAFVAACLLCKGKPSAMVSEELLLWAAWWTGVNRLDGDPPPSAPLATTLEAVEPPPTDSPDPEPERAEVSHGRFRTVLIVATSTVIGLAAGAALTGWWLRPSTGPDPSLAYGICAEAVPPTTGVGHTVLSAETGPPGKPVPDRRIELRVQRHPDRGWIAWAQLERSASPLDRLWLDWSYLSNPGSDHADYRQCGAQTLDVGRGTPGILVVDEQDRPRWFRACGQAPPEHRAPDRSGTFCTSWNRPRV
ncbi:hypothetical protein ACFQ68_02825 [Amycolatopsis japonica]|uniref:hypothetical protein n=1 Tax=Amycolatopsis japonica TaxID=208439 RepID=UPI00366F3BF9